MRKKICVILVLLLSLQMCTTAYADTTSKNDFLIIRDLIGERLNGDNMDFFDAYEEVTVQGQCVFTLTDMTITASERNGMMDVLAFLKVKSMVEGLSLMDYDFMLFELSGQNQGSEEGYHFPEAVYGDVNGRFQQFAWPVGVGTEDEMDIALRYTVAKDATELGLLYTSIIDNGQEYRSTDNLKVYVKYRTQMDFAFYNSCGKTISELYVAPSSAKSWGKNFLAAYSDPTLEDDEWMEVGFKGTAYEDRTGENWDMRVVFEDGTDASFSEIDLDACVKLEMFPRDEDGRYTLQLTR